MSDDVSGLLPFAEPRAAYAGSVVYPPGGKFGPRIQQDIQLVMLYTGEMNVTIDGRLLSVSPGHVALLRPGRLENFIFSKSEQTWHRWIAVRVSVVDERLRRILDELPEVLPLTEPMNRLADLMLQRQRQVARPDDPVLRSLGLAALHLYPNEPVRNVRAEEKHPAVYAAIDYIRTHYADPISLTLLASHAGVSPEHLLRLFKRHEDQPPIGYLWRFRVERAVDLLTNTGLTVTEIADRCGFQTSHHLARLLKKTTGSTAKEIRRLSWNAPARMVGLN